ncbi:MAG: hypothetical protein ACE5JD_00045 [Candidatus Methylomirabilia bacterium]
MFGAASSKRISPDLSTLRLIPWLPKTALVFCDVYTEEGDPIEEAPRWVLRPAGVLHHHQQWLAGQVAMGREFAYFNAPTVNAYKR